MWFVEGIVKNVKFTMFDMITARFAEYGCILRAVRGTCRHYSASVLDGQSSYPLKATERQFIIKKNM